MTDNSNSIKLMAHQAAAVERARIVDHLALFYDVGTGKTATIITALREDFNKNKRIKRVLVFAPLSVCPQWKVEFLKFSKVPESVIHVLTGPGKKKKEYLARLNIGKKGGVVVTNYESVQNKEVYAELMKWGPEVAIADESHLCKDSTGVRSKLLFPLFQQAERRFLMTGTPAPQSMLDLYGQFKLLDASIFNCSFFAFRNRYFYDANAGMPSHVHFPKWVPRSNAEKEMAEVFGKYTMQAKRDECLDLPPLNRIMHHVELSPGQRKAYIEMEKHFVTEVAGEFVTAEFAMTKTLRMQQILSGFLEAGDKPVEFDNPRLDALEDIIASYPKGEKIIIWTIFRPTYPILAKLCEKLGKTPVMLTGDQSAAEKEVSKESFLRGEANVLIANPAAGGTGLNLQESKVSVYFSRGYNLAHQIQSEARNYRAGSQQHSVVNHHYLVSTGTLDEVISRALLYKLNVAEEVLAWARKKP